MNKLKNILSIWIIANILFIPGFKSSGLLHNQTDYICKIYAIDASDHDTNSGILKMKKHCENCKFFCDNYASQHILANYIFTNSIVLEFHIDYDHPPSKSNSVSFSTRAPPLKT